MWLRSSAVALRNRIISNFIFLNSNFKFLNYLQSRQSCSENRLIGYSDTSPTFHQLLYKTSGPPDRDIVPRGNTLSASPRTWPWSIDWLPVILAPTATSHLQMVLGLSLHMASKGNWIENAGVDAAAAAAVCRLLNAEQTHMINSNIALSVADPF